MKTENEKYIIVQGGNIQNAVNLKIEKGYKPIGGIAMLHDSESGFWFSQAMILPEDDIEGFIAEEKDFDVAIKSLITNKNDS